LWSRFEVALLGHDILLQVHGFDPTVIMPQ
jgi:hypothetical protein